MNNQQEFDHLWDLIHSYSTMNLPDTRPKLISRIALQNASYVVLPNRGKVVLIPDSAPIIALYCSEQQLDNNECDGNKSVLVGTVGDIKDWLEQKQKRIGSSFDLILSIISVILGLVLELKPSKE